MITNTDNIDYDFVDKFLSRFSYDDWTDKSVAEEENYIEDGIMRVDDFVIIMFEDSYTHNQTFHWARIVMDEDYQLPYFAVNEELDELEDSGEIWGIYETALNGAFFNKVSKKSWFEDPRDF